MSRTFLILSCMLSLLPMGCVASREYKGKGDVVVQKQKEQKETKEVISASYFYPDVRVSFNEAVTTSWQERTCSRVTKGRYEYSVVGDASEVVLGPVIFASAVGETVHNVLFLDFSKESISDNFDHLLTTLPGIQNQDTATSPDDSGKTENTGELQCKNWTKRSKEISKGSKGKTINIVAEDGTILYQCMTNDNGEAFINVCEVYKQLFREGKQPAKAVELVSGKSCDLIIKADEVISEAEKAGDPDPRTDS